MAHLKTDFHINNENEGQSVLLPAKAVNESARKRMVKKQAFGELKNVIHNQSLEKGLKTDEGSKKHCIGDGRQPHGLMQTQNCEPRSGTAFSSKPAKKCAPVKTEEEEGIELLDYIDIERKCCRQPYKSDHQIWCDMNVFDDSLLEKIITGCRLGDDEETVEVPNFEIDLDKSDSEDIMDFNNPKFFPTMYVLEDNSDDAASSVKLEYYDFL